MKMSTLDTAKSSAESSIHGRALPALVFVRSTTCPATRLPMIMSIAESMGNMVRKPSTVPASAEPEASSSANSILRK